VDAAQSHCFETKLLKLKLKTSPKWLFGYFQLDIAHPEAAMAINKNYSKTFTP
jgi:hypothetical protein